jgi:tetratricopeptide (TPR) repeat protein
MGKFYAIAAAAMLWASTAFAAQDPAPDSGVERERAALAAVMDQIQQHDADAKTEAAFVAILSDPAFARLSDNERHLAYLMYSAVLLDDGKYLIASRMLGQANIIQAPGEVDWDLRLRISYALHDYADAARAAAKVARSWPDELRSYNDDAVFRLAREIQKPGGDPQAAEEFLAAMFDDKWKPESAFRTADTLWFGLARLRLGHGDAAGAREAAAAIGDPETLIRMRSDKRFDALVAADPGHYDVMKAYDRLLAGERAASARMPDKLEGVNRVTGILFTLNRMQESLDLLDAALARAKAKSDAFGDADDQLNWSFNQRARVLFYLGRSDEGFRAMESGAAMKEGGQVNVSQAINLAGEYDAYDRPKDALRAIEKLGPKDMSPYGTLSLEDTRACAYFELSDKTNLAETLDTMKAHAEDGIQPFLNTMLFIGDLDAASAYVIAHLEDASQRSDMLYFLQTYLPMPNATVRENTVHANWTALRTRPDVAAAIAKAGRVETYALTSPSY